MKITIMTIGSRGDVQPYVALGVGLAQAGYEIRIATHAYFESFVHGYGLDFIEMANNPGLTIPIDVAQGANGSIWVLEFAQFESENPFAYCFTGEGYLPQTGRLSRLAEDGSELKMDGLHYPGAILPLADGGILYSEGFSDRIL